MQALVVTPGEPHSVRVAEHPVEAAESAVLVRTLEVGVCGTDREISEGIFGVAPGDERALVLGHELLGVVEHDGHGFSRGDLVTATVRRSCRRCVACEEGAPDSCLTGDYRERGIPRALGRLGVLAEPASICARGLRHARAIGNRQPWRAERALVIGAGAIGMLVTYLLRLEGLDVWTAALDPPGSPRARLVEASGARYVASRETPLEDLRDEVGGFDLVVEAAGDAQVMAATLGLLRRSGVACLLGIDPRERTVELDGPTIGLDAVLENRVLFGSVNAHREDWVAAVNGLARARERWPEALESFVTLRVPLDRFGEAFEHRGVKATLVLGETGGAR